MAKQATAATISSRDLQQMDKMEVSHERFEIRENMRRKFFWTRNAMPQTLMTFDLSGILTVVLSSHDHELIKTERARKWFDMMTGNTASRFFRNRDWILTIMSVENIVTRHHAVKVTSVSTNLGEKWNLLLLCRKLAIKLEFKSIRKFGRVDLLLMPVVEQRQNADSFNAQQRRICLGVRTNSS